MLKYLFFAILLSCASVRAQTDAISEVAATQAVNEISAPSAPVATPTQPLVVPAQEPAQVVPDAPVTQATPAQTPSVAETADVAVTGVITVNESGLFVMRNDTRELVRLIPVDEAQQNTLLGLNGHPITVSGKLAPELVITSVAEQ